MISALAIAFLCSLNIGTSLFHPLALDLFFFKKKLLLQEKTTMSARRPHNQSSADVTAKPAPQGTSDVAPAVPA